ncbi:Chitin synthase, class 2 [Phlyctochytrium planicorne]|nr:Chitin synthase, class 2 [Phlyctochytrium planicorne]
MSSNQLDQDDDDALRPSTQTIQDITPFYANALPNLSIPYNIPRSLTPVYDGMVSAIAFTKGLFRHRTVRTVELTSFGNFVVEIDVPMKVKSHAMKKIGSLSVAKGSKEFSHLRYSAVTCDPDEFMKRGFTLRPSELKRQTELFIVITMYNENDRLFLKTWKAIVKNVSYICKSKLPPWGKDGWQKIVVCVVADGREKIHRRTLTALGLMGVYQEGVIKTSVNGEMVTAHVFEYTTTTLVDQDFSLREGAIPIQILFCLKEKNARKLNSHRWFFNAFGKVLNPKICVLIDVGTKPTDRSIFQLWKAFDTNPQVGGACGEIFVETGLGCHKLLNPLVAAQNFEYKISNILDKPLESCFGFISVLPGAFSAYRYCALQNGDDGRGPLEKYFMGELQHFAASASKANMYLAEDRILCFELVSKRNEAWLLKYVRSARAETDVPDTIADFLVASAIQNSDTDPFFGYGSYVFIALREFYLMAIVLVFLSSLGNRPHGSKNLYFVLFFLFSIMMASLLYVSFYKVYQSLPRTAKDWQNYDALNPSSTVAVLFLSVLSTYGVYFLASFLFMDPWHMFTSFVQYLLMLPSFVNILMVYACRLLRRSGEPKTDIDAIYEKYIKDMTDKPKPVSKKKSDPRESQEDFFRLFRTRVVIFWMASNALLILALTTPQLASHLGISDSGSNNAYLNVMFWSICCLSLIRFIGVVVFLIGGLLGR